MRPFAIRICAKLTTFGSSPHQVHQLAQQKVGYHANATALHFLTCIGFFDMRRESEVWIAETVSRDVEAAAHAIGLQTHVMLARADEVIE
jgi:hypothetical protein